MSTVKRCTNASCSTLHSHPTRDLCMVCSGWACKKCGRSKTPEQETCGRKGCKVSFAKKNKSRESGRVIHIRRQAK